jgi:hypothetical protein
MTRLATALLAPVLLCGLFGPVVLAQDAGPATRMSQEMVNASYDMGNATVFAAGYAFTGESADASASFSIVDNFTYETLAYCQSMSPSVNVKPSGAAEVRFTPQVDALCTSDAPIVLTCESGADTFISFSTYNSVNKGFGATQIGHNVGWNMGGLRCAIVSLGVEYQAVGNAMLFRYLTN